MVKPIATIPDGKIQGIYSKDFSNNVFSSFLGIPYAEPPIGDLRFKAPVPVKAWSGILDATKAGPACPQNHILFQYFVGKENNCLNLNVYTRSLPDGKSTVKPVMVYIHGGAYITGSNSRHYYGPEFLMTEDIVLVVLNYRLGIFGFLSLEDPSLNIPGNAGMKDIVLALKWVQKNIKYFNGNSKNVTIFGESAGAVCVHLLVLSNMSVGLFHKAIIQSGSALCEWAMGGGSNGKILAEYLHYGTENESTILQLLLKESAKTLVKIVNKIKTDFLVTQKRVIAPVVETSLSDDSFLCELPIDIMRKGNFQKVPLIVGFTSLEGLLYEIVLMLYPKIRRKATIRDHIPFSLNFEPHSTQSIELENQLKEFYFDGNVKKKFSDKLYKLKTDALFVHPINRTVSLLKKNSDAPIFYYCVSLDTCLNQGKLFFTNKCPILYTLILLCSYKCVFLRKCYLTLLRAIPNRKIHGACHTDELYYIFKQFYTPKVRKGSLEEISICRFIKLWTNFAKYGNPTLQKNDAIQINWQPVSREINHFLDIDEELTMKKDPLEDRMTFWDRYFF